MKRKDEKVQVNVVVSESEFEEILGHNAAVVQFGGTHKEMLIDTSNLKVNKNLNRKIKSLPSEEKYVVEESDYARGYHKALELIERKNPKCPY